MLHAFRANRSPNCLAQQLSSPQPDLGVSELPGSKVEIRPAKTPNSWGSIRNVHGFGHTWLSKVSAQACQSRERHCLGSLSSHASIAVSGSFCLSVYLSTYSLCMYLCIHVLCMYVRSFGSLGRVPAKVKKFLSLTVTVDPLSHILYVTFSSVSWDVCAGKTSEASIRGSSISSPCLDAPDQFQLRLIHFPRVMRATITRSNQGTNLLKIIKRAVMQIRHAQQAPNASSCCSVSGNTSVKQLIEPVVFCINSVIRMSLSNGLPVPL